MSRRAINQLESCQILGTGYGAVATMFRPPDLHRAAWELATRLDQPTAYHAHLLALAQELDCPFWTGDHRLYRATSDTLPGVNLLPTSS